MVEIDFESVEMNEQQKNTQKTIQIGKVSLSESQIREYGSQTKNLKESNYTQKKGNIALLGNGKFTPSKTGQMKGFAKVTLNDGNEWYIGLSPSFSGSVKATKAITD